jgi:hypothetical protein
MFYATKFRYLTAYKYLLLAYSFGNATLKIPHHITVTKVVL